MTARRMVVGVVSACCVALAPASVAHAQAWCQAWVGDFFDTSSDCTASSDIDRVFGNELLDWGDDSYLVLNTGNDLALYDLNTSPDDPPLAAESYFGVPNQGDSDYDLMSFSVCDECRFGAANFRLGLLVFDLGTGAEPAFTTHRRWSEATSTMGSFVFRRGDDDVYLVANGLADACAGPTASVYRIRNPSGTITLTRVGCASGAGGTTLEILGGAALTDGDGNQYLWLADTNNFIHIFEVTDVGASLALTRVGPATTMRANMGRGRGLDVDPVSHLAVTVWSTDGARLYDVSDPAAPTLLWSQPALNVTRAALAAPLLWVGRLGSVYDTHTFDISTPTAPFELDVVSGGFWNPNQIWNRATCERDQDGVFSRDGMWLYLTRYTVGQVYSMSNCRDLPPPEAGLEQQPPGPADLFPGSNVTITDTSDGFITASAIWVTAGSDPAGTVVAGSPLLSPSTPSSRPFAIPVAVAAATGYWAHVAVENDDNPYGAGAPAIQLASHEVLFSRTPLVTIVLGPPVVVTTTVAHLSAVPEGQPGVAGGGSPYSWRLTSPTGTVTTSQAAAFDTTFGESGNWQIVLTTSYRHEDPLGGGTPYQTISTLSTEIRTIIADLRVAPDPPLVQHQILLDNRTRAATDASLDFDWDVRTVSGALVDELPGCDGPASFTEDCMVPANTLTPGTYDFTITAHNISSNGSSQATIRATVINRDLDAVWVTLAPSSLHVGEIGAFAIHGAVELERAMWNFGGLGCAPFSQITHCVPSTTNTCLTQAFAYLAGGARTAELTLRVDGVNHGPFSVPVPVNASGSCGGGCSYAIAPQLSGVSADAQYGFLEVTTLAGCNWAAVSDRTWLHVEDPSPGGAFGSLELVWRVDANTTANERSGHLTVGGQVLTVVQRVPCAATPPSAAIQIQPDPALPGELISFSASGPGGTSQPDEWHWLLSLGDDGAITSQLATFDHTFERPGLYPVTLAVANCAGSDEAATTVVVQPPLQLAFDAAATHPLHTTPTAAAVFDDQLYVGTAAGAGGGLFREDAGGVWTALSTNGLGDAANNAVTALTAFHGMLYAGTSNPASGCQLRRSADGLSWTPVVSGGFGGPADHTVTALEVAGDELFAAVSSSDGASVWRSSDGVAWAPASSAGFGQPANEAAGWLARFAGALFASASDAVQATAWVWRGGTDWDQVGADGLGSSTNTASTSARDHLGELYAGTANALAGAELRRLTGATSWLPVADGGFGEPAGNIAVSALASDGPRLYASTRNAVAGAEIWASADRVTWWPWSESGFGDADNVAATVMLIHNGALQVGVENPAGFRWYALELPLPLLFEDDLETGTCEDWSACP